MEEAASMKLKHSILGLLLLFTLIPLGIFGIFSIYETNRKIDELTEQNVRAISGSTSPSFIKICKALSTVPTCWRVMVAIIWAV